MKLEIGNVFINDVKLGNETKVENHILYVNEEEIKNIVLEDERIKNVSIELARPGESKRITPVKDVIEPRVKVSGKGTIFPGVIGKVDTVGTGRTHVLKGAAIVTCGKIVGFQEGIIDMSGPGADYTPFSKLNNVCMVIEPEEDLNQYEYEAAARMAGLKIATYVGEVAKDMEPDEVKEFETKPLLDQQKEYPDLPKVGYIYMLQTQGLLHDTYVYGVDAKQIIPTIMYPTEIMDGAIISGNCVSACDKNTTYHHLNNPIIQNLFKRHGKDINFMGAIITNENVYLADKERSSNFTTKLAEFLGLDGVIISQEGFGNPDTDLIMNCKKIEKAGIKTVIVTDEYAGRDGLSQSLADADLRANAVVTGGNANQVIVLPKMDQIIGTDDYINKIAGGFDGSLRNDGSIEVEIQAITGATNELGFNRLTAKSL
ncbi:glycine/sarcosine/betaine reductase component B subunit [Haloplasma contractile]|uniref:Glycine reductase subunit ABC protein n=1 Tax=Haloplasma contractile SSD-17B TaxID=1033810 RepID=U2FQ94_9MOLU|nr:glycine/sarcosine/betaine reductase component B subunit [Haloplasma contractile]ERJ13209.1 Glycine reductase subunit ABC protein [Haloplasma contractile SSD-17B]